MKSENRTIGVNLSKFIPIARKHANSSSSPSFWKQGGDILMSNFLTICEKAGRRPEGMFWSTIRSVKKKHRLQPGQMEFRFK